MNLIYFSIKMTPIQAAQYIHKYGNVGRSPEELLKERPTEFALKAAREICHETLVNAFMVMERYHKKTHFPITIRYETGEEQLINEPAALPCGVPFTIVATHVV